MNVTCTIKVCLANVVGFVTNTWILFLHLFEHFTFNHHVTCTDFHHLKRFGHGKLFGTFDYVEHIVADQVFKLTWFHIRVGTSGSSNVVPINGLLWIRSTDNVFIERHQCQYVLSIVINVRIDKKHVCVFRAQEFIDKIISCSRDKRFIEQERKLSFDAILVHGGL